MADSSIQLKQAAGRSRPAATPFLDEDVGEVFTISRYKEVTMASLDFRRQLEGYGLTTAGIYYRLPDYQRIIQLFVWQKYDIHPEFPELRKFLDFWRRSLDGPLHSVVVTHAALIRPAELRVRDGEFSVQ